MDASAMLDGAENRAWSGAVLSHAIGGKPCSLLSLLASRCALSSSSSLLRSAAFLGGFWGTNAFSGGHHAPSQLPLT